MTLRRVKRFYGGSFLLAAGAVACSGREEFTAYPVMCPGWSLAQRCTSPTPLNRSRYRVDVERQEVLSWSPGISEIPERLYGCTARSATNWVCKDPEGQRSVGVENGRFFERWPAAPERAEIVYVSRSRWWLLRLGLSRSVGSVATL